MSTREVWTEYSRRSLRLAEELGRGAEGVVFGVRGDSTIAIKVRVDGGCYPDREARRLRALTELGLPEHPAGDNRLLCAWPREPVVDAGGRVVGFVMRRASPRSLRLASFLVPRQREEVAPNLSFATVSELAADIAALIHAVQALGVTICDLNERGVLLLPDKSIMLIDLDSAQFIDRRGLGYLSPLYTEECLAPELDPYQLNQVPRATDHVHYALAVLLFRLLMVGFEPYTGRRKDGGPNDLAEQSRSGSFAYSARVDTIAPPLRAPSIEVLSSEVRSLFERTFIDGARAPGTRASASDFERALRRQASALVPCDGARTHLTLTSTCHWCKWDRLVGLSSGRPIHRSRPKLQRVPAAKRARVASPGRKSVATPLPRRWDRLRAAVGNMRLASRPRSLSSRAVVLTVLFTVAGLALMVKSAESAPSTRRTRCTAVECLRPSTKNVLQPSPLDPRHDISISTPQPGKIKLLAGRPRHTCASAHTCIAVSSALTWPWSDASGVRCVACTGSPQVS